jgi:hypothetical protein
MPCVSQASGTKQLNLRLGCMPHTKKPFSLAEYTLIAADLEVMADSIRARPEMDHDLANRLVRIAMEIREDCLRAHPVDMVL